ncbi:MAG: Hpt domain-containing protein [Deltaproteobacteria bacterium]|nr:Hpt domain-containing protein [Deltaproteobacteria bacterium]
MALNTPELTADFVADAEAMLNQFDENLMDLATAPQDEELLTDSRRIVHTLNGTAGFLGFSGLCEVAKAGEQLLSRLCEGALQLSRERLRCLQDTSEVLRGWAQRIADGSPIPCARHERLLSELMRLAQSDR